MPNAHKQAALKRREKEKVIAAQKYRPFMPTGKVYARNGARECERRRRQMSTTANKSFDMQTYVKAYEAAE
jgi:hypothetical protein